MIPDSLEAAVRTAANQGIRTVFGRIVKRLELLARHVRRVKPGTWQTVRIAADKGLAVKTVPRPIVDMRILPLHRIGNGIHQGLVTEILLPVHRIDLVRCKSVKIEHFLAVVADSGEVRSRDCNYGIITHTPVKRRSLILACRDEHHIYCQPPQISLFIIMSISNYRILER